MPIYECGCLKDLSRQQIYNHTRRGKARITDKILARSSQVIDDRYNHLVCNVESGLEKIYKEATRPRVLPNKSPHTLTDDTNRPSDSPYPGNAQAHKNDQAQVLLEDYETGPITTRGHPDWVDFEDLRVQEVHGVQLDGHLDDWVAEHESTYEMCHGFDAWDDTDLPVGLSAKDIILEFEKEHASKIQHEIDDSSE